MNEETKKTIGEAADKFAFQVPYNGTSDFYNNDRHEGFIAGATWAITTFNADEQLQEQKGLRWVKGDYEKLYRLAKDGYRIACYVDYDFYRDGGTHPKLRDICSIGHNPTHLEFGARGIGYSTYIEPGENELEEFLIECNRLNVEWLEETEPGQPVPAGEWISVEENLPRKFKDNENFSVSVLVTDGEINPDGILNAGVASYNFHSGYWSYPEFPPKYWQYLPAPPSPKQEDKL